MDAALQNGPQISLFIFGFPGFEFRSDRLFKENNNWESMRALLVVFIEERLASSANGAWLLVRGLVKRPGKARPNQLSNSTLEFHQTPYQKLYPIEETILSSY